MTAINFPAGAANGATHTEAGVTWTFDGTTWNTSGLGYLTAGDADTKYVNVSGDQMTGDLKVGGTAGAPNITLKADGTASLKAGAVNVDPSGRLLVGTTSWTASSNGISLGDNSSSRILITNNADFCAELYGASANKIAFYSSAGGATRVGTITVSTTATAYNTSSDYRLKENVVLLTGAIDRVNQLQVHRFNFIADPEKTVDGFIAHEAQAVVPECVTGEKDAVDDDGNPIYQGIDQSKLVPLLTAALQEALQKIEDLEGRLTAAGL